MSKFYDLNSLDSVFVCNVEFVVAAFSKKKKKSIILIRTGDLKRTNQID